MIGRIALRLLNVFLVMCLILLALLAVLMTRLALGPMEIPYLAASVENSLTRMRAGRPVELGKLQIAWSTEKQELLFIAEDVLFYSKSDTVLGRADIAEFNIRLTDALQKKLSITKATLNGGYIEIEREPNDIWRFADVPIKIPRAEKAPESLDAWLILINALTPQILDFGDRFSRTVLLDSLIINNAQIIITSKAGANLVLDQLSIAISNTGDGLKGSVQTAIANQGLPLFMAQWSMSDGYNRARADVRFTGPRWSNFFQAVELLPDKSSELSISLGLSRDRGLETVRADTRIANGHLGLEGRPHLSFSKLAGSLMLDVLADTLSFRDLDIVTQQFDGIVSGRVDSVVHTDGLLGFDLEFDTFNAKFWSLYDTKTYFPSAKFSGEIDLATNGLRLDNFEIETPKFTINGEGKLKPAKMIEAKDPPFALEMTARIPEKLTIADFLEYWPVLVAPAAREWVNANVDKGDIQNIAVNLNLSPQTVREGIMQENSIDLKFSASAVQSRFANDLPAIENATGLFQLKDNEMIITLLEGEFSGWSLEQGKVHFPKLNPKGEDMHISMRGSGPIQSLYKALSDSTLDLDTMTGFEAERFSGLAEGQVLITRPTGPNIAPEDVTYSAQGRMRYAGLTNVLDDYDITDAQGDIRINNAGMWIDGFGKFEHVLGEFSWHSDFLKNDGSRITAKGNITPSNLAIFGMPARGWMNGSMPYWMTGHIHKSGESIWTAGGDLAPVDIDLPWINWSKSREIAGRIDLNYRVDTLGGSRLRLGLDSEDATLKLDSQFDAQLRLKKADLTKVKIEDRADFAALIRRNSESEAEIIANGRYVNLEDILAVDSIFYGGGQFVMPDIKLVLSGSFDALALRDGHFISDFRSIMQSEGDVWRTVKLSGKPNGKGDLTLDYTDPKGQNPQVELDTSDAGFTLDIGLLITQIKGGRLRVSGTLFDETTANPGEVLVNISDGKLVDVPFLTQILTLASPRGLADTLAGEGILFSNISSPIKLLKDKLLFTKGRASGPALGITAQGYLDYDGGIRVDGVLVPSYTINSALKAVPLIGDLVVGRSGEGILSISYNLSGTIYETLIRTNPLSALTPGILRRIFEDPDDTYLEDILNQAKADIKPQPSEGVNVEPNP